MLNNNNKLILMSCLSVGDNVKNWYTNMGFAFANLIGVGDAIKNATGYKTPYDDLNDQLSQINAETSDFRNRANIALFGELFNVDRKLFNAIVLGNSDLIATINYVDESLKEKISLNTYYIMFVYIFFLVIYCYLMIKK